MLDFLKNWVNYVKLLVAGIVVACNYIFGWGLDSEAIAGIGVALAIPVELWGFVTDLIAKLVARLRE